MNSPWQRATIQAAASYMRERISIGLTDPGSLTLRVSARLTGAKPFAIFKSVIDPLVASAATKVPR